MVVEGMELDYVTDYNEGNVSLVKFKLRLLRIKRF